MFDFKLSLGHSLMYMQSLGQSCLLHTQQQAHSNIVHFHLSLLPQHVLTLRHSESACLLLRLSLVTTQAACIVWLRSASSTCALPLHMHVLLM